MAWRTLVFAKINNPSTEVGWEPPRFDTTVHPLDSNIEFLQPSPSPFAVTNHRFEDTYVACGILKAKTWFGFLLL